MHQLGVLQLSESCLQMSPSSWGLCSRVRVMTGCCDVVGALEDTMESFFLSETAKYLYLLHSNATTLPDFYIFSTEGHLLPVLPYEEPSLQSPGPATMVQKPKHGTCRDLCRARSQEELLKVRKSLSSCRPSPVIGSNHYVPAALQRHKILGFPGSFSPRAASCLSRSRRG